MNYKASTVTTSQSSSPLELPAKECPYKATKAMATTEITTTAINSPKNNRKQLLLLPRLRKKMEVALQFGLTKVVRPTAHIASSCVITILKPVKLYAYQTRFPLVKRAILEITTPMDFAMIWMNIQNETMELHARSYGGNFLFGKSVMITDHETTCREVVKPVYKCNDFMGVNIVSSTSDVFATNTGILNQNPPIRKSTRRYLDETIFNERVYSYDYAKLAEEARHILAEWSLDPEMASTVKIRATVTRIFLMALDQTTITKKDADDVTFNYMRRFVEYSLLQGYLPLVTGLLGTRAHIRKDVYTKLRAYNIDNMTIDITLFAAMFSVGTLVIRCVENIKRYTVNYSNLTDQQKRRYIIESVRLYPTVTTVARVLEREETVKVANKTLQLEVGDQICYPFVCSNQDPNAFTNPDQLDVNRSDDELDSVLSWSKGPHACPAKELSIQVTQLMLDKLDECTDISRLTIFNPAF
jgi:hypothetical protein